MMICKQSKSEMMKKQKDEMKEDWIHEVKSKKYHMHDKFRR